MNENRILLKVSFAWFLMGFSSMIGQVVLMRELLVVFHGNEISLGIILACWLFWVGMGSLVFGRLVTRIENRMRVFVLSQLLLAFFLLLSIVLARISKLAIGVTPGEIVGLLPMIGISFVLLAPLCVVLGFLFALSCRLFLTETSKAAPHIGRIYVLEAGGATLGGALFSYFLIHVLNPFQIVWLVSTSNLVTALIISLSRSYFRKRILALVAFSSLVANLAFGVWGLDAIHRSSLRWQWPGFRLISSEDSIYGNVTVNERGDQRNVFGNGLLLFVQPDRFVAEESVHFALLEHPNPRRVLLIGGGVSGALVEILKHPIEEVTYVELDPLVIQVAQRFLSKEGLMLESPKVTLHHLDGRLFVKRTPGKYDVIIVNLPEPFTAQLNRFYTVEFFRETKRILSDNGIVSFRVTSAENYISDDLQKLLSSYYQTLRRVFGEVKILPGNTNVFLACQQRGVLTYDAKVLVGRLKERGIQTNYVREYYLPFRLESERIDYLNDRVFESDRVQFNSDFHPISTFYNMIQWTTQFRSPLSSVLRGLGRVTLTWTLLPLGVASLLLFVWGLCSAGFRRSALLVALGVTGALEIIFEVIILIAFQILYGFVYSKIGILLMGFMVGLTLGGWWMTKRVETEKVTYGNVLKIQAALCVYPLAMIAAFKGLSVLSGNTIVFLSTEILFPFLIAIGGFLGGAQFPLVNRLYIERWGRIGNAGGKSYGVDVLGSSLGALVGSSLLIPILGIWNTCIFLSGLSLFAFLLLLAEGIVPLKEVS